MKILIVDDSEQMRHMIRMYLEDLTDEIRECDDGEDSLTAYAAFFPDYVLMDWEMKKMDGLTAATKLLKTYPEARILMVTQYDDVFLRQSANEAGVCGYILKDDLVSLRLIIAGTEN